jgi:hypothetical protein
MPRKRALKPEVANGIREVRLVRTLLARRRREKHVDSKLETRVFATFEDDIRRGFLIRHPIPATTAA